MTKVLPDDARLMLLIALAWLIMDEHESEALSIPVPGNSPRASRKHFCRCRCRDSDDGQSAWFPCQTWKTARRVPAETSVSGARQWLAIIGGLHDVAIVQHPTQPHAVAVCQVCNPAGIREPGPCRTNLMAGGNRSIPSVALSDLYPGLRLGETYPASPIASIDQKPGYDIDLSVGPNLAQPLATLRVRVVLGSRADEFGRHLTAYGFVLPPRVVAQWAEQWPVLSVTISVPIVDGQEQRLCSVVFHDLFNPADPA